jgi:hypothetical protein
MAERVFFISDKNFEVASFSQCQVKTLVRSHIQGELAICEKRIIDRFTIAWQRGFFIS